MLDDLLEKANVPYSYGFAIILLTVLVKVATFPLSKKQVCARVCVRVCVYACAKEPSRTAQDASHSQKA